MPIYDPDWHEEASRAISKILADEIDDELAQEVANEISQLEPIHCRDPWEDYNWGKPSRAVVACDGYGNGCILHYVGAHLSYEISEMGNRNLSDLSMDDAPEGLSIWEGKMVTSTSYYGEVDAWLEGDFRDLTADEMAAVAKGDSPWNEEDWLNPEANPNATCPHCGNKYSKNTSLCTHEFHRCRDCVWSKPTKSVLDQFPTAKRALLTPCEAHK